MSRQLRAVAALLVSGLACSRVASAGQTAKVGGDGGTSTVSMDCGSGFVVGSFADGSQDTPVGGMTLVRSIQLTCRQFQDGVPVNSTTATPMANAFYRGPGQKSRATEICPTDSAVQSLSLRAEIFIDRFKSFKCTSRFGVLSTQSMNVGGFGGQDKELNCPAGEALYKIDARIGGAIDSLKGYCRSFVEACNLISRMKASLAPDPSPTNQVRVAANTSKTFTFNAPDCGAGTLFKVGVAGEVADSKTSAAASLPEYTIELLKPSGTVIGTKSVIRPSNSALQYVNVVAAVAGTWSIRVTNTKASGALDILDISIAPN